MPDDQQKSDHQSAKPHLRVRVWSDQTDAIAVRSPHSSDNPSTDEEKTPVHPNASDSGSKTMTASSPAKSASFWSFDRLPSALQWVPANWNWSKWKPVLRSALAAWICLLLFLIPTTLNVMGQVGIPCSCFIFLISGSFRQLS